MSLLVNAELLGKRQIKIHVFHACPGTNKDQNHLIILNYLRLLTIVKHVGYWTLAFRVSLHRACNKRETIAEDLIPENLKSHVTTNK